MMLFSLPTLRPLGLTSFELTQLDADDGSVQPARVAQVAHGGARLLTADGPVEGLVPSPLRAAPGGPLVAGDWVVIDDEATVVRRLERRTTIARAAAGRRTRRQVIAAPGGAVRLRPWAPRRRDPPTVTSPEDPRTLDLRRRLRAMRPPPARGDDRTPAPRGLRLVGSEASVVGDPRRAVVGDSRASSCGRWRCTTIASPTSSA